jgi:hypothetical protein
VHFLAHALVHGVQRHIADALFVVHVDSAFP